MGSHGVEGLVHAIFDGPLVRLGGHSDNDGLLADEVAVSVEGLVAVSAGGRGGPLLGDESDNSACPCWASCSPTPVPYGDGKLRKVNGPTRRSATANELASLERRP